MTDRYTSRLIMDRTYSMVLADRFESFTVALRGLVSVGWFGSIVHISMCGTSHFLPSGVNFEQDVVASHSL